MPWPKLILSMPVVACWYLSSLPGISRSLENRNASNRAGSGYSFGSWLMAWLNTVVRTPCGRIWPVDSPRPLGLVTIRGMLTGRGRISSRLHSFNASVYTPNEGGLSRCDSLAKLSSLRSFGRCILLIAISLPTTVITSALICSTHSRGAAARSNTIYDRALDRLYIEANVASSWSRPNCAEFGGLRYWEMNQPIMSPPGPSFSSWLKPSLWASNGASFCSLIFLCLFKDLTCRRNGATNRRIGCGISRSTSHARDTSPV